MDGYKTPCNGERERLPTYVYRINCARHLVSSHSRAHPNFDSENPAQDLVTQAQSARPIPQDLLRKYIMYARGQVKPQLHNVDTDKISKLYAELRRESVTSGGVPIAVRHIESIMRMSEAYARMHLRDHVRDDDVDMAIRVTLESFIQAQKFSVMRSLRRGFQKYLTYKKDNDELLLFMLQGLVKDQQTYMMLRHQVNPQIEIPCEELAAKAREFGIHDTNEFFKSKVFAAHNFQLMTDQDNRRFVVF